jgi:hypothetical protein
MKHVIHVTHSTYSKKYRLILNDLGGGIQFSLAVMGWKSGNRFLAAAAAAAVVMFALKQTFQFHFSRTDIRNINVTAIIPSRARLQLSTAMLQFSSISRCSRALARIHPQSSDPQNEKCVMRIFSLYLSSISQVISSAAAVA